MKVRPSTSSRRTIRFATSHTTRAAIVSVLPLPAPATTSAGSSGDSMTAVCSRGRRELAERGGDDRRRQGAGGDGCRHDALTAPIVWMRHRPYEYSSRQCSSYGAVNDVPRMTATAVADAREEQLAPLVVERRLPRLGVVRPRRGRPQHEQLRAAGRVPGRRGDRAGLERELVRAELRVVDDLRVGLRLALAGLQIHDHDRALGRQLDAVDVAGEDHAVLERLGVVERDRDLEVRLGADQRAAGLLEAAEVQVQAPHEVARAGALGAVAPLRLERQLAPARLDLRPQARLVRALGVLERGVDDRAEPRGGAAGIAAEVADDPVELALLERVQPRRRHAHVLAREIAQRTGRRSARATPYHSPRRGARQPGVGEHGELPRRPRGARRARPDRSAPAGAGRRARAATADGRRCAAPGRAGTRRRRSGRCRRRRRR